MAEAKISGPKIINRAVDFVVLGLTFYLSCLFLSIETGLNLVTQSFLYAIVMLLFVHLAKQLLSNWKSSLSKMTWQVVSNAAGMAVGAFTIIVLEQLFMTNSELIVGVVIASVMAFFILGTLLPLLDKNTPTT